jgi:hypothetical protein
MLYCQCLCSGCIKSILQTSACENIVQLHAWTSVSRETHTQETIPVTKYHDRPWHVDRQKTPIPLNMAVNCIELIIIILYFLCGAWSLSANRHTANDVLEGGAHRNSVLESKINYDCNFPFFCRNLRPVFLSFLPSWFICATRSDTQATNYARAIN